MYKRGRITLRQLHPPDEMPQRAWVWPDDASDFILIHGGDHRNGTYTNPRGRRMICRERKPVLLELDTQVVFQINRSHRSGERVANPWVYASEFDTNDGQSAATPERKGDFVEYPSC